jgi:hypothetical protein
MVERIDIERGLDKIAPDEAGYRFQSVGVALAKLRWPEPIAGELQKLSVSENHQKGSTYANRMSPLPFRQSLRFQAL